MNRRKFLGSIFIGTVLFPNISSPNVKLKKERRSDYIDILTSEELRQYGVRGAMYSATVFDTNGFFYHEKEYNGIEKTPFVTKFHVSKTLPRCWSSDYNSVYDFLENDFETFKHLLIEECKQNMAYTSNVQYISFSCMCGNEKCPTHYSPIIRGLSMYRYKTYLKNC